MNEKIKDKLEMLQHKVNAKSKDKLIYALCKMTYKYRLFEELQMELENDK